MALEPDSGFLKEALGWLVSAAVAALTWLLSRVIKQHDEEIADVKATAEAAMPRRDWEVARDESTRERANMRSDIKELFDKHDSLKDYINVRVEAIEGRIMDKLERLRVDMNGGMNSIRDQIGNQNRRRD